MLTALDAPSDALDQHERTFVENIREHGWFRNGVFADDDHVGFAYTTGFWISAKQPELIIFSLSQDVSHKVFWDLFRDAKDGAALLIGKRTDGVFGGAPAYAFPVAKKHYRELLGWSRWFYGGDDFPCLQIVWPDRNGVFPWEPNFETDFQSSQPDLTERGWANEVAR